ncbi:hypothetical protein EW026_g96 [Hermanssonia centrifuga]|uniref:Fibronectin type III-like domain-containing protein n=1 Tax=Hermanssonia centrifuga TaxID=98765 RepID=A0A4S4KVW6_9APHY|nr:hypothetical protein EW026_g96 [Hermanssonia centrifuga]
MSLNDKVNLGTGVQWQKGPCVGNIPTISSIPGFTGLCLQDSPVGVRYADKISVFPAEINVAATFNRTLMRERGAAMGAEFKGKGAHVALGPMMNLMRAPAAGRNWEGGGGDPFLSGEVAFETIVGIQSSGVQACAKHFINNEQEHFRDSSSSNVDDRTGEFGFQGFVTSDWWATHSGATAVNAGLDMTMPGDETTNSGTTYFGQNLVNAVQSGQVSQARIDDLATRILAAWYLLGQDTNFPAVNFNSWNVGAGQHIDVSGNHGSLIRQIDAASTVLLKNTNSALPLKAPKSIGIIGNDAGSNPNGPNNFTDRSGDVGVLGLGWGSGTADFPYLIAPADAITTRANTDGAAVTTSLSDTDLTGAANAASGKDVAIVFINADSGEGYLTVEGNAGDRNDLSAWHGGDALVQQVAKFNNNTVVVVNSVGPINMEAWVTNPNVTAVVWSGIPGQEAGNAVTDVLYGAYNPGGKLPYTIGKSINDYAAQITTSGSGIVQIPYNEGIFIDYRHFDQANISPRFEFGFGLSYTTFDYSDLEISGSTAGGVRQPPGLGSALDPWLHEPVVTATFTLTNNGTVAGTEVPQLYTSPPAAAQSAPFNLKGFDSVYLAAGSSTTVTFNLSRYDFSTWDVAAQRWNIPSGTLPEKNCASITPPYAQLLEKLQSVRNILGNKPLTLAEKILYSHIANPAESLSDGKLVRGETYLQLNPERVAMQDASAQMALLQFMSAGMSRCAVPASIHCDHLIQAVNGADPDLQRSIVTNKEVFDFLESASRKYGIEFWQPGSGIIHQIVLENYAAPGMLMLGTDSHTPNAGGLGMLAIGVGGADAVDALTGTPWELKAPQIVGIHLTGELNGWATPKDLILHLAGKLTVRGGTGRILEYFGPGVFNQSCTGLATVANMGAEVGATTSTFPYTPSMRAYLTATGRAPVSRAADEAASRGFLAADEGAEYDQLIEINLSELEPNINGPFTPDLATPLSKFGSFVNEQGWKDELSAGLIGSCTNSSYQDMTSVADLARQAKAAGLKTKVPFLCTPGSEQIRATMERDKVTDILEDVGAVVLANACGPCIGQWKREDRKDEENAILTSFNRNFKSRNDGNRLTMNFLASPTIVTAMAFSGKLSFNPMTDSIPLPSGEEFKFSPPRGEDLPSQGFTAGRAFFYPSPTPEPQSDTQVIIKPDSQRLELLAPFLSPFGDYNPRGLELPSLKVLMRVRGKCTTDHISAAGPWLKYKGHLTNISENLLITAVNDEGGDVNVAFDHDHSPSESEKDTIPGIAKRFKARNQPWALIVDENYGEGSAREHAALQPRYYGCAAIIARSFARIHETNLKKQGILPLWFVDNADYSRIGSGDMIETVGVEDLLKGKANATVTIHVTKRNGETFTIPTRHTMSKDQLKWLHAGSALNHIRSRIN